MKRASLGPALDVYLRELHTATRDLPADSQRKLSAQTWKSLAALTEGNQDEEAVATAVARLDPPGELAAAERERLGLTARASGFGGRERVTVYLLVGSLLLPVLGAVIGAVLLWTSAGWSQRTRTVTSWVMAGAAVASLLLVTVGLDLGLTVLLGTLVVGPMAGGLYLLVVSAPARRELAQARRRAQFSERPGRKSAQPKAQPKRPEM